MFADQPRRLAAASIQWPFVILGILLPARFGMAQQVQQMHRRVPPKQDRLALSRRHDTSASAR